MRTSNARGIAVGGGRWAAPSPRSAQRQAWPRGRARDNRPHRGPIRPGRAERPARRPGGCGAGPRTSPRTRRPCSPAWARRPPPSRRPWHSPKAVRSASGRGSRRGSRRGCRRRRRARWQRFSVERTVASATLRRAQRGALAVESPPGRGAHESPPEADTSDGWPRAPRSPQPALPARSPKEAGPGGRPRYAGTGPRRGRVGARGHGVASAYRRASPSSVEVCEMAVPSRPTLCTRRRLSLAPSTRPPGRDVHALYLLRLFQLSPKAAKNRFGVEYAFL
jgi:hypothetical protein